jgi:hypothetical protein
MQGMMVMLMAMSGLGCHHGHSGYAASACYDACYSSASFSGCYDDYAATAYSACYDGGSAACYGACFDSGPSCYTYDSCYAPEAPTGCCLFRGLKRLFGKHHRSSCYDSCYGSCYTAGYDAYDSCYSSCYGQPVFGSYTPVYSGGSYGIGAMSYGSAQGGVMMGTPSKGFPTGGVINGTSQVISGAPQASYLGASQAAPSSGATQATEEATPPAAETPAATETETPSPPAAADPAPPAVPPATS